MLILPAVQGACAIRTPAPEFLRRMQARTAAGLLSGRPHPRANYTSTQTGPASLHIRAADWLTAINVGLNEVDLRTAQPGLLRYEVQYWRWAGFAIGFSAGLGAIGLALLLLTDVRSYIARHPAGMIPGFSVDQNLLVAWGMVLFWGFLWPWILIALHRRPLRRLIERLIAEVDAA